jgi:hypothetical protein
MTTVEFQRRIDSCELGDAPQWFDWDGFSALAASLAAKLTAAEVDLLGMSLHSPAQ